MSSETDAVLSAASVWPIADSTAASAARTAAIC